MGLQQVQRTEDAVYFKCWDEEDHHSLRMRYDPRTGLDSFTFRVEREDDLHEFEKQGRGLRLPDHAGCRRGEAVGQGESLRFEVPSGQIMELVWDIEKTGNILGKHNPSPVPPPDLPGHRAAADGPHAGQRRGGRPRRHASSSTCWACG